MKSETTKWIIIGVVVLIVLLGVGVLIAKSNAAPAPVIPNPNPNPPTPAPTPGNAIDTLISLFKSLFKRNSLEGVAYVQVLPIDEDGCDALGYNKVGIKCSSIGF